MVEVVGEVFGAEHGAVADFAEVFEGLVADDDAEQGCGSLSVGGCGG